MRSLSTAQRNRVTMLDVATRAGVSKASVSRFIGDDRALLSELTAARIERAIAELGYRPNQMARGLKRGRTRLIGMLVADLRNPYSIAVMHSVESACRRHGYSLVMCNTDGANAAQGEPLAAVRAYNVEGLIVNTAGHHLAELRELHREMPMVLIDRKLDQLDSDLVGLDNRAAVATAIGHLQAQGYRDLALISEPQDGTSSRTERAAAFQTQLAAQPALRGEVIYTGAQLGPSLNAFLTRPGPGPKAFFCANGVATLATTLALHALGRRLFEGFGLLALDELDWYPLVGGGITALAQPTEEIGVQALECLLQRLQGSQLPSRTVDFAARLVVRGSTRRIE
jgi:LacI family kdg operon repressor